MSHEAMDGLSGFKLQKFKSSIYVWNILYRTFNAGDMRALENNYTNFLSNIKAVNNAISEAGIDGIDVINEKITQSDIRLLADKLNNLQEFTKDIHNDAKRLIDEPFNNKMKELLGNVQEHSNIHVSAGGNTYDLSEITDENAYYQIATIMQYGQCAELERFYEEYEKSENYDPTVLARYKLAERIAKGGAPYSQEFIDSWLLNEDNYLAYLVVKQMMYPDEDQGIGSFLESVSNRNKAITMLNPSFKMTPEQEKQARKMADSEIAKMDQGAVAKYSIIYYSRNKTEYEEKIRELSEKEKIEYSQYEIYRMLKDKTSVASSYVSGIEGYAIPVQKWIKLAYADINGTFLEMLGIKPYGYAQQQAEDVEKEFERKALDKANASTQHPYATIAGGATVDMALYYFTGGILESYGLTAGMSTTAAFATNQYVQFVQDATISYLPHYLEYAADGNFSDAEKVALLNEMLWGEAANLALGSLDVYVKTKYANPVTAGFDYVEPSKQSHVSLNEANKYGDTTFKYEHNPSDNPKVLRDAIEDPNAVYGYRPRADGSLGELATEDWSDPVMVEDNRIKRIKYHEDTAKYRDIVNDMTAKGASTEEIAQTVCDCRNQTRINSYINPDGSISNEAGYRAALKRAESNSYENLIKRGKTPEDIIESACRSNPAADACLGLYDDYFNTY